MKPKRTADLSLFLTVTGLLLASLAFVYTASSAQDTVFLKKRSRGGRDMIFIDTSRTSKFYSSFGPVDLQSIWSDTNNAELYHSLDSTLWSKVPVRHFSNNIKGLPGQWYPLKRYRGAFYLYDCCDGISWRSWVITDSAIIPIQSDFNGSFSLREAEYKSDSTWRFEIQGIEDSLPESYSVTLLPGSQHIYRWSSFPGYSDKPVYLTSVSNVHKFPIIVNYCEDEKELEVEFDENGGAKIY